MFDRSSGGDPGPLMFAVVRFEPGEGRQVRDTVVTFNSPTAADLFAIEQGWHDYEVTPLRFFVHELRPAPDGLRPPVGSRMNLDDLVTRFATRRRWA